MNLRQIFEDIKYFLDDRTLLEMVNLHPHETNLKPIIQISGKGGSKHGPRIKVSNVAGTFSHNDNFSVAAFDEPKVIAGKCKLHPKHKQDVLDWVKLNKQHIHHVWHNSDIMDHNEISNGFRNLDK